jgi:hypothetical protein
MSDGTTNGTKLRNIQVQAACNGYEITINLDCSLDHLPAVLDLLHQRGINPTAQQFQWTPDGRPICPKHGVPMEKREKQGDAWYSHRIFDPHTGEEKYCRGYPTGKENDGYI